MSFIGIIAENAEYEFIKSKIKVKENLEIIRITKKDIENVKNIKFETIVICKEIKEFKSKQTYLNSIIANAKYLVINTDIKELPILAVNKKLNIITYGLNQKATVTASSIGEDEVIVCLQRNIEDRKGNIIETQETKIMNKKINNKTVYNLLAAFIILQIY